MEQIQLFLNALLATWLIMGPYLLIGFLIAGLLHAWLDKEILLKFLGNNGAFQTVKAVILGIPIPVCSCGVIPISATLRQKGAGSGATAGFMLTTPQTGLDSLYATWGILGAPLAIFRILAALVSGMVAGFVAHWVSLRVKERPDPDSNSHNSSERSCCSSSKETARVAIGTKLKLAIKFGFITLPRDVFMPVFVGVLVAAIATTWLPANVWGALDLPVWAGYLLVLFFSLPVYVCSTGAIPIAWALALAGMSPGAVLIFLVAGPASNAGTFAMLAQNIGIRASLAAVSVFTLFLLCLGISIDVLQIDLLRHITASEHLHLEENSWVNAILGVIALFVFSVSYIGLLLEKKRAASQMHCCNEKTPSKNCCG